MSGNMVEEDQNDTLRSKFISVVGPVFAEGDEANISTVLNSLSSLCYQEGLFVTRMDSGSVVTEAASKGVSGRDRACEFTCWLLTELITICGTPKVCKANVNLQVTIMHLLATRNSALFAVVIEEYIQIGLEAKEVLFDGETVIYQCFPTVINSPDAHPKPKSISFMDNDQLDNILTNIVKVIGNLGDYIHQYCRNVMNQAWLLLCTCLEGGDMPLKAASLIALSSFLDACGLPRDSLRLDYMLQCVEGAYVLAVSRIKVKDTGSTESSANDCQMEIENDDTPSFELSLANVIQCLKPCLPSLLKVFQEELILKLSKSLQVPGTLENMSGLLRKAVLECCSVVMDLPKENLQCRGLISAFEFCVNDHLMIPEVAGVILKKLVKLDLQEALPTDCVVSDTSSSTSRKRKYSEMEATGVSIDVESLSKWWKLALRKVDTSLKLWSEQPSVLPLTEVAAVCHIIATTAHVAVELPQTKVLLQFLPDEWLQSITDSVFNILMEVENIYQVISVMELMRHVSWAVCVVDRSTDQSKLKEMWLALATLPWMASEVNVLDLKAAAQGKKISLWANKIKWNNDSKVKSQSIAVIAVLDDKVAPRWRCHVVRAIISENEPVVMLEVAHWFPVMVHQLGRAGGQQLVGEVIGAILHSPDPRVVEAGAVSLKHLLCSLLNLTSFKASKFAETGISSNILHCQVCDPQNCTVGDQQKVDPTLVARFIGLLDHSEVGIVVAVVESLPAVVSHANLSAQMVNRYLSLLLHKDKRIVTVIAKHLSSLVSSSKTKAALQDTRSGTASKEGEIVLSYLDDLLKTNDPAESLSNDVHLAVAEALHYLSKFAETGISSNILHCQVCDPQNCTVVDQQKVDPTLVARFIGLLDHSEVRIVVAVVESLPAVDTRSGTASKEGEIVLSYLDDLLKTNDPAESLSNDVHLAVAEALHYLSKSPVTGLVGRMLVLLVRCQASTDRLVTAKSHLTIHALANALGLNLMDLYIRHRQSLAKVLVEIIKPGEVGVMLNYVAEIFKWSSSANGSKRMKSKFSSFITSQIRYLLPPLVVRASQENKPSLLQELAACLTIRLRDVLIDHFQHILPYLVFNLSEEEQVTVLNFIADTTDIAIHNIRRCSVQNQVNELVLGLHDHRAAVLREFSHMRDAEFESAESTTKKSKKSFESGLSSSGNLKGIAEYLSPRLLGILGFLDSKLVSSSTMYKEKRSALWSLSDLILVMGKQHISSVAHKVLASLKTSLKLRDEEFYDVGCNAWTNFLYNLDETTLLGLIEEIIILIIPLVKVRPQQMAPVLNDILVGVHFYTCLLAPYADGAVLLKIDRIKDYLNDLCMEFKVLLIMDNAGGHPLDPNYEGVQLKFLPANTTSLLQPMDHGVICAFKALYSLKSLEHLVKAMDIDKIQHLAIDKAVQLMRMLGGEGFNDITEDEVGTLIDAQSDPLMGQDLEELMKSASEEEDTPDSGDEGLSLKRLSRIMRASRELQDITGAWDPYMECSTMHAWRPIITSSSSYLHHYSSDYAANSSVSSINIHHWMFNRYPVLFKGSANAIRPHYKVSDCAYLMTEEICFKFLPLILQLAMKILCLGTCTKIILDKQNIVCSIYLSHKSAFSMADIQSLLNQLPSPFMLLGDFNAHNPLWVGDSIDNGGNVIEELNNIVLNDDGSKSSEGVGLTVVKDGFCDVAKLPPSASVYTAELSAIVKGLDIVTLGSQGMKKWTEKQRIPVSKEKLLQCIYVSLDEPDGVAGVAAIRRDDPSLEEQVLEYEATGRLQDALGCYERMCVSQSSEEIYKGLLDCYLNLDQPHSVLNITSGLLSHRPELESSLSDYRVEAAWRLGQWNQLETLMEKGSSQLSWGTGIGQVFLAVRAQDATGYQNSLRKLRSQHITPMSAASMEKWAYQRAYPYILRLHMLTELEELVSGLLQLKLTTESHLRLSGQETELRANLGHQQPLKLNELIESWDRRLSLVQTSHRYLEPILNFRRTLLELAREIKEESDAVLSSSLKVEVERLWLQSAKVARKAGHLQQGEWALLGAGCGQNVFMEKAKWHWIKGEQHQAVTTLHRGIARFFSSVDSYKGDNSKDTQEERSACGKAKLLLARYSEESATLEVNVIKQYYRDACEIFRQWEDGHFHLGMYYDRILSSLDVKEKPVDWINHIVLSFGKSLQFGCRHIYQSMPRMLALWLEFGTRVCELESKEDKSRSTRKNSMLETYREKLASLNGAVGALVDRLPHYLFLTALPQLISRICHSNAEVFVQLCKIIACVLSSYPQQAMWHMIAVSKSSYQMRVKRCLEIFETAKRKNSSLHKFIADCTKLADKFLELSNKPVEKGIQHVSLNTLLRGLPRLLTDPDFSDIILPLQQQMSVTLPASSESLDSHNPFSKNQVYLENIEDQIEIMQSLQLPKKITLRGSDGKPYIMMCKPKDDLRKDCRLMEFNSFINRCLLRDPESRKRDLHIRTYAVVPLNEECGLIEWIENLHGLRHIIYRILKEMGVCMTTSELKQHMCKLETPLSKKREVFVQIMVPRHPPVFGMWFLRTFPDSQAWLKARLAYCRTTAVMSMVGYVLGLGDRHGENILFDASCGDTVHVDFNCLFNKGETFDWPERVPFRLTHNMVAAMGPTGYEGIYRKSCEVTMRVMREEREALMSILNPFIHDPLVEWSRGDNKAKTGGTGEINNEKAQMHVSNIEHRLSGQINTKARGPNLPLSVAGQVNALIEGATSIDNLCQMYIGWAAYM
ncbi:serine/threonine-protein kinase ATR [Macrobrachium rosenbergii]|uniref:serine/threonine-protein kinase ATR n=1 Tax=Macrobrachium rosenbergii TaxID=79674 RepID=UPI0034D50FF8